VVCREPKPAALKATKLWVRPVVLNTVIGPAADQKTARNVIRLRR
jgi:hypothetical protein